MPPDYSATGLATAAGADPWALHRRLAGGDAEAIRAAAVAFRAAAVAAEETSRQGGDADRTVAAAYTNDGAAVFDAPASTAQTHRLLADGGEQMEESARALVQVADALVEHTAAADRHLQGLEADVQDIVTTRNNRLAGPTALTAEELAVEEERHHRTAVDAVAADARRIEREVEDYDRVVANRAGRIAGFGDATVRSGGGGADRDRGFVGGLADLGAAAVNGAASLGNALLHNPLAAGGLVVGAAGVVAGGAVALAGGTVSLSGGGAVVGVPATGAGLALAAGGGALVAASAAELSDAASGADRVEPLPTGGALTAEEKDAVVRDAVFDEAGEPVGSSGSDPSVRVVGAEQFREMEQTLRSQLGSPDRVIDVPGKGRIELWDVAAGQTVTHRSFSSSGDRGVSGAETLDLKGFEGVRKIHYRED